MDVLNCFSHESPKLTLHELSTALGLPKSTVHRLASVLCETGLLEQISPHGKYRLGIKLFELGSLYLDKVELNKASYLVVRKLQQVTGENVHLCLFNGTRPVMVYRKTMNTDPINTITTLEAAPAYCTGVGKAILAFQPEAHLNRVLRSEIKAFTPNTHKSEASLRDDLRQIRERGYAIDNGEHQELIRCVAAPIKNSFGVSFAAISVSSSIDRMPDDRLESLAEIVLGAASEIEARLQVIGETG